MKQQWEQQWTQLTSKIDALTLRERGIMLLVISAAIVFLFNSLLIDPQFAKQKILSDKSSKSRHKSPRRVWKLHSAWQT